MKGKYAFVILDIYIPSQDLDVNVHPQKAEVRFSNESMIYRAVYHALVNTLSQEAMSVDYSFGKDPTEKAPATQVPATPAVSAPSVSKPVVPAPKAEAPKTDYSKNIGFLVINDGSCFQTLQVVYSQETEDFAGIAALNDGAAVLASGGMLAARKIAENGMTFALAKQEEAIRFE